MQKCFYIGLGASLAVVLADKPAATASALLKRFKAACPTVPGETLHAELKTFKTKTSEIK